MLYEIELERSLAEKIREMGNEQKLIIKAIQFYLERNQVRVLSDEERTRISPKLCSVLDGEVIRLEIPDKVWRNLKDFSTKNKVRVRDVIKEAILEYLDKQE